MVAPLVAAVCLAGSALALILSLPAMGFTTAGVAAGSVAASLQGPAVAAGSWFAAAQSAGATLTAAAAAKAAVAAGAVGYAAAHL